MRAAVDDSFLLLEHGEVWTIDDFVNVVKPADYIRTNYFSVINSRVEGNVAFINYWNKANFKNADKSADIYWLESVVVSKVGDKWLLSQMHSTRLPQGETPKGVTFIETVKLVYNENGMVGFYNGLPPQLVNAVLKEGILNMIRLEIRAMVESNITARLMR